MKTARRAQQAWGLAWLAAVVVVAGCASVPAPAEGVRDDRPACPPAAVCARCATCPAEPVAARHEPVAWSALPGWPPGDLAGGLAAFVAGCARLGSTGRWAGSCERARRLPAGDEAAAREFFESAFAPYRVTTSHGETEGLVTGYYEPVLAGRRVRDETFRVPVLGVPDDLVVVDLAAVHPEGRPPGLRGRLEGRRVVPYDSRRQIEERISGRSGRPGLPAPVLAWLADPLDLFFLQVQGSGQVALESGERLRLGFADHNGHPYRSLGRYLVERGALAPEQVSMEAIRGWAAAHPDRLREALDQNPRYVFFRELPAVGGGPPGSLGVPLTAGHSVAVDPQHVAPGSPIFLATTDPVSGRPLARLVVAQDTGAAIRGPLRLDLFWGTGEEAGRRAGRMRHPGRLWLLWPREAGPPAP